MAYDSTKLVKLAALKALAQKVQSDYALKTELSALSTRVDDLVTAGGEPNVITAIKVNGTAQAITDKAVDIKVPGYTVVKDENSGDYAAIYHFQKDGVNEGVAINIPKDMVVSSGEVVTNPAGQKKGTYLKLVLANAESSEIFIPVDTLIEYVTSGSAEGDMVFVTVDPETHKVTATITDGTITKAKLDAAVQASLDKADSAVQAGDLTPYAKTADVVAKEEGKRLMTDAEGTKLDGISEGATKVEASETNGNVKVDGVEVKVYTEPNDVVHGAIASDAEVTEMLNEVFTVA